MSAVLTTRTVPRRVLPSSPATGAQRRLLVAVIVLLVVHVAATVVFVLGG